MTESDERTWCGEKPAGCGLACAGLRLLGEYRLGRAREFVDIGGRAPSSAHAGAGRARLANDPSSAEGKAAAADIDAVDQLKQALISWQPRVAAPLAATGLSAHRQGGALNFQIEHGSQVVAGLPDPGGVQL